MKGFLSTLPQAHPSFHLSCNIEIPHTARYFPTFTSNRADLQFEDWNRFSTPQSRQAVQLREDVGLTAEGIGAGLAVSGAVDSDGHAWLWGAGWSNQLGKGVDNENEIEDEKVPLQLAITTKLVGKRVTFIQFGGQHVVLLAARTPT